MNQRNSKSRLGISLAEELQLLSKIAEGDHHAFKLFYDHYRSLVYNFALKYLRSPELAEEAVQEIFLKLWRQGTRLKEINNPEHYLMSVSRNRCIDLLRQMRIESIHMQQLSANKQTELTNETEEQLILRETRKILEEGIALLPPQQKLVYTLCHTEGRKQIEVASELQLSPNTVKRHMKLSLKFLRDYMTYHTDITIIIIILKLF